MTANLPIPYDPEFAAWQQPQQRYTIDSLLTLRSKMYPNGPEVASGDFWERVEDPLLGRPMYFDKQATPISMRQWAELRELGLDPDGHYGESSYIRIGENKVGEAKVSTVWLGIDHGWLSRTEREALGVEYRPVIFETMIFGGKFDQWQRRYCTEWDAIKGHAEAVEDLKMGMRPWWTQGGQEDDEWRPQEGDG